MVTAVQGHVTTIQERCRVLDDQHQRAHAQLRGVETNVQEIQVEMERPGRGGSSVERSLVEAKLLMPSELGNDYHQA